MDASGVHELDFLMLFHEVLEIRLMLEEVGVKFLVVEGQVRLDVVVELDDIELDAVLFQERFDDLENLGMRDGRSADFQRLHARGVLGDSVRPRARAIAAAAAGKGQRCDHERTDE